MNKDKYFVLENVTVENAVLQMEKNASKAVLVVNADGVMKGLFTLGDMRRFILHGGTLSDNITKAMNVKPFVFSSIYEAENSSRKLVIYPVIGEGGKVIEVLDGKEQIENHVLKNVPVVIMAGGKGTRLKPYTNVLPKALIPIGDVTITERIIETFFKYGCRDFYMILNHKAGMIKAYFQDLEKEYSLTMEVEKNFLGTAGGLGYLKEKIGKTFFLSNCDILIRADFESIYKTHKKRGNLITAVTAMKNVKLPYGIIEADKKGYVTAVKEKPEMSYLTNTGVYLIEPCVIKSIKKNEKIHMTDLMQRLMEQGEKVGVYPVPENAWLDMGQLNEMEEMFKSLRIK